MSGQLGTAKSLSLANIRPWQGSVDRAFEELAYQLLKDDAPPGSSPIRTGNPDGGVEWYAELPDGQQWGWQAKNISDIDDLLKGMTESLNTVVVERPALSRLTFVISQNLSTGKSKNKQKSRRDKYEDKVKTWQTTIAGAERIDFHLIQESDLLERLARPQNRGRSWFWWEEASLSIEWLSALQRRQAEIAGQKYRPDLQVDLPISKDLAGLGRSDLLADELTTLRSGLTEASKHIPAATVDIPVLHIECQRLLDALEPLVTFMGRKEPLSEATQHFDVMEITVTSCLESLERVREAVFAHRPAKQPSHQRVAPEEKNIEESLDRIQYDCRCLYEWLSQIQEWLLSTSTRCLRSGLYFLLGEAGSGKTHLLVDSTEAALSEERPAVLLHGAHFSGPLWASICDQMGLPQMGADVLLDAMDSAAEASGLDGSKFVISIDALNETSGSEYWRANLPVLRSAIRQRPHLALAVSCRDTYTEVIDPAQERAHFVQVTHPGFAGFEVEATHKYFDHYGLATPRIPLLTPEFSVPLFLRLYCEALSNGKKADDAVGHKGRIEIFERFLDAKVALVAQRVFAQSTSNFAVKQNVKRVRAALDSLVDAMANSRADWIDIDLASAVVSESLGGNQSQALDVVGAFESEGVLIEEPSFLQYSSGPSSIRITFQAFSDFLLLSRRLAQIENPIADDGLRRWLRDEASWGILEAATIVFPEKYDVELPDFLGSGDKDLSWISDEVTHSHRMRFIFESFITNLPNRTAKSVTQRTIDLINFGVRSIDIRCDLFEVLFSIAPQPDHTLNAYGLHRNLSKLSMPIRDSWFGFAVYDKIWDERSAVTRLARWAAAGPYPTYPIEIIDSAAIALAWLLSSPNRFMRDWITKSLVQLLHRHLDVVAKLFERFWMVNDPYVVQRVTVIAYGCLMRGGLLDPDGATKLSRSVLDHAFAKPMRSDELLLDAARGAVEWAVAHGLLASRY